MKALITGSFDPVTLGHLNIIKRAYKDGRVEVSKRIIK